MNKFEIEKVIEKLSKHQGFYSRILKNIREDKSGMILDHLEEQGFRDEIDLILFLEDWD